MAKTVKVEMGAVVKAEPSIEVKPVDQEVPGEFNSQSVEASVGKEISVTGSAEMNCITLADVPMLLTKPGPVAELPIAEIANEVTSAAIGQPLPAIYRLKEDIPENGHHHKGGLENAYLKKDAFCLVREKQGNPADPLLLIESVTDEYKPSGKIAWARLDQLTKIQ